MRNLTDFALRLEYERVKDLGDKLVDIGGRLNWEGFRPPLEAMYRNNTECGGRPNLDVIVMLKSLFIQQLYSLSDEQLEREIADRISFRVFLGTTETVPDSTTIWKFRERLAEKGVDQKIWAEMQRQLDAMKLKVQKGIMQDATFITSDPGHANADTPRGDEAKTRVIQALMFGAFNRTQILLAAMRPKPGEVKMERGRRKELNPFSAISCMMPWMRNLVWLEG